MRAQRLPFRSSAKNVNLWAAYAGVLLSLGCSGPSAQLCPAPASARQPVEQRSEFPSVVLGNDQLEMLVYLPDPNKGYYRGTRFDRSGIIGSLRVGSHTFVQPWQETHDPTAHDAVTGPAEEFGMESPLGYATAKPGEAFIKIGVGELQRVNQEPYMFNGEYPLVRALPWKVERAAQQVAFFQELPLTRGFGYQYTKVLKLVPGLPALVIEHRLKNTGSLPIHTNHYVHNFFLIDGQLVGPSYRVRFGFPVTGQISPPELAKLDNNVLSVLAPLPPKASLFGSLLPRESPSAFWLELENTQVQASVKVSGEFAPEKLAVWAVREALCPEVFVTLQLPPSAEKTWATRYFFATPPPKTDD